MRALDEGIDAEAIKEKAAEIMGTTTKAIKVKQLAGMPCHVHWVQAQQLMLVMFQAR